MVTWKDLNIQVAGKDNDTVYDHGKAVDLHNKISDLMQGQKFLPRQLQWEPFDLESPGPFTHESVSGQFDTVECIVCLVK